MRELKGNAGVFLPKQYFLIITYLIIEVEGILVNMSMTYTTQYY